MNDKESVERIFPGAAVSASLLGTAEDGTQEWVAVVVAPHGDAYGATEEEAIANAYKDCVAKFYRKTCEEMYERKRRQKLLTEFDTNGVSVQ